MGTFFGDCGCRVVTVCAAVLCCLLGSVNSAAYQPHIIVIVADDMGWNDVSFHGSDQIQTPNIDALAYNGVILNSHYVQPLCTPSRSALLTGKYPIRLGMQGQPLLPAEPAALPAAKLMPEYFKELGYNTHIVGKWHLGYVRWNDTPTYRGFDHHFGYYNGQTSYYDYICTTRINGTDYSGFDLRRDRESAWNETGEYATRAFAKEAVKTIESHDVEKPLFLYLPHLAVHAGNEGKLLEAPQETIEKFRHVVDPNRRTYAAMVSELDDAVGAVVEALGKKSMLQNSVVLFLSDNGAPNRGGFYNWGSNHPLRGVKDTLFEGGVRSASLVWSPLIVQNARVSTELMHVTDWLPTLYSAAGGTYDGLAEDLDGQDQWSSLVYDLPSARSEALININEKTRNAALRFNNWKLIVGLPDIEENDGYFGESGKTNLRRLSYNLTAINQSPAGKAITKVTYTPLTDQDYEALRIQATLKCLPARSKRNVCNLRDGEVCLYDVPNDPCEENNLSPYFPAIVRRLKHLLVEYRKGMTPQINQDLDIERADPKLFQYTWNPWLDCADSSCAAA